MPEVKKNLFCAQCQVETEQSFRVEKEELIAKCGCGREIKFPASMNASELKTAFGAHKKVNIGQVPAANVPIDADHPVLKALSQI